MNRVEPGSFLTLHYRLSGPEGEAFIDTFGAQPATLSLGTGELAPAMESRLIGLEEGSSARFEIAAGEAFGARQTELVQRIGRAALERLGDAGDDADPDAEGNARYSVGDVVRFAAPDGQSSFAGVVRDVADDTLLFDFNHPLAGRPVTFEVELIGVL